MNPPSQPRVIINHGCHYFRGKEHCALCLSSMPYRIYFGEDGVVTKMSDWLCAPCHYLVCLEMHARCRRPAGCHYPEGQRNVDTPIRDPRQGRAVHVADREAENLYVRPPVYTQAAISPESPRIAQETRSHSD